MSTSMNFTTLYSIKKISILCVVGTESNFSVTY